MMASLYQSVAAVTDLMLGPELFCGNDLVARVCQSLPGVLLFSRLRTNRWSVSKVAMVNTLTPASANGTVSAASTPTSEKDNGPSTSNHTQVSGRAISGGTRLISQTIESSSGVRVIDENRPRCAQAGTGESGGSLTVANRAECWMSLMTGQG